MKELVITTSLIPFLHSILTKDLLYKIGKSVHSMGRLAMCGHTLIRYTDTTVLSFEDQMKSGLLD